MSAKIIQRNQKHFGQALGSPPTTKHFEECLGKYRENRESGLDKCLASDMADHLPEKVALLESLKSDRLPLIESYLEIKDIKRGIKVWRGKTSTSPSGKKYQHVSRLSGTKR